jgi:hypothetical protein
MVKAIRRKKQINNSEEIWPKESNLTETDIEVNSLFSFNRLEYERVCKRCKWWATEVYL